MVSTHDLVQRKVKASDTQVKMAVRAFAEHGRRDNGMHGLLFYIQGESFGL